MSQSRNDPVPSLLVGVVFFLDGSTHLISLDDFPRKKIGEHSRKTEKFLHKVKFLKCVSGQINESARIEFFS